MIGDGKMKVIRITDQQRLQFQDVIDFVKQEHKFKNKRVTHADAFTLLLQLYQRSRDSGMMPNE